MYPNLKADLKGVATLNQKRIGSVTDKLQEENFPEEHPGTSIKCMIGLNVQGNTEMNKLRLVVRFAGGLRIRNLEWIHLMKIYRYVQ